MLQPAELRRFDGRGHERIYLAIIGDVFDVTTGSRHAPEGSGYPNLNPNPNPNPNPNLAHAATSVHQWMCMHVLVHARVLLPALAQRLAPPGTTHPVIRTRTSRGALLARVRHRPGGGPH